MFVENMSRKFQFN